MGISSSGDSYLILMWNTIDIVLEYAENQKYIADAIPMRPRILYWFLIVQFDTFLPTTDPIGPWKNMFFNCYSAILIDFKLSNVLFKIRQYLNFGTLMFIHLVSFEQCHRLSPNVMFHCHISYWYPAICVASPIKTKTKTKLQQNLIERILPH